MDLPVLPNDRLLDLEGACALDDGDVSLPRKFEAMPCKEDHEVCHMLLPKGLLFFEADNFDEFVLVLLEPSESVLDIVLLERYLLGIGDAFRRGEVDDARLTPSVSS